MMQESKVAIVHDQPTIVFTVASGMHESEIMQKCSVCGDLFPAVEFLNHWHRMHSNVLIKAGEDGGCYCYCYLVSCSSCHETFFPFTTGFDVITNHSCPRLKAAFECKRCHCQSATTSQIHDYVLNSEFYSCKILRRLAYVLQHANLRRISNINAIPFHPIYSEARRVSAQVTPDSIDVICKTAMQHILNGLMVQEGKPMLGTPFDWPMDKNLFRIVPSLKPQLPAVTVEDPSATPRRDYGDDKKITSPLLICYCLHKSESAFKPCKIADHGGGAIYRICISFQVVRSWFFFAPLRLSGLMGIISSGLSGTTPLISENEALGFIFLSHIKSEILPIDIDISASELLATQDKKPAKRLDVSGFLAEIMEALSLGLVSSQK